ncbi:type II toxin-antitoxin system HicA family toxin [Candidatus Binatus sp.]|uniref:type II toxin-antitoxin system HicA family toxin n=1 Tax=Candidatus Binatus sp. TaxID=2811406 RepID=UPI003C4DF25E
MRLPRDLSGADLARLLRRYGYEVSRQTGSHLRLTSTMKGTEHHVTIPAHKDLKLGTLGSILSEVADYLKEEREDLAKELFK